MSSDVLWPLLCLMLGLALAFFEVFVPSGGLLGILSAGLLMVSMWLAFGESTLLGLKFLLALLVGLPACLGLAVRVWPHTPMGRLLTLRPPADEEIEPAPAAVAGGTRLDYLVGQFGRAVTPLRPSGVVEFDGRRLEGQAEEGLIAAGSVVRAVHARGGRLVVREATAELLPQDLVIDPPSA